MSSFQNQNEANGQSGTPDFFAILYFVANVLATSVAVFIRRNFGREALGLHSVGAVLLLYFLSASDRIFLVFTGAFIVGQVWRRIETFRFIRGGAIVHSRYPGDPYWAMKVPFVKSEKVAKELVEPVMCFTVGLLFCPVSVGIGGYLVICGIGFIVRNCIDDALGRKRIERMRDATIEHQWYSNQMRR